MVKTLTLCFTLLLILGNKNAESIEIDLKKATQRINEIKTSLFKTHNSIKFNESDKQNYSLSLNACKDRIEQEERNIEAIIKKYNDEVTPFKLQLIDSQKALELMSIHVYLLKSHLEGDLFEGETKDRDNPSKEYDQNNVWDLLDKGKKNIELVFPDKKESRGSYFPRGGGIGLEKAITDFGDCSGVGHGCYSYHLSIINQAGKIEFFILKARFFPHEIEQTKQAENQNTE